MALPRTILVIVVLNTLVLIASTGLNVYLLSGAGARNTADSTLDTFLESEESAQSAAREYQFFPVEKIIVNLRGSNRERYFVLDLVLQADLAVAQNRLEQIDPIVRNSVVANLSAMGFEDLRNLSISEVQERLEAALTADLLAKQLNKPFDHVLVSKMIVQ